MYYCCGWEFGGELLFLCCAPSDTKALGVFVIFVLCHRNDCAGFCFFLPFYFINSTPVVEMASSRLCRVG